MIPREEYPRPQFRRSGWINLNGAWEFEKDPGNSGNDRGFYRKDAVFSQTINVPFCLQSKLSGIEDKDFIRSVWYKKEVTLSADQADGVTVLHIGACDYLTSVYVNEAKVGTHKGGYVSFSFDISDYLHEGRNTVVIHAEDNERDRLIPRGKQSELYYSHGCDYTRTTGIWQTVWLEFMPKTHIGSVKVLPSADTQSVSLIVDLKGASVFEAEAFFDGRSVGKIVQASDGSQLTVNLPLTEKHLWELGKGGLYDLKMKYGSDTVDSYFGLRSISYRDKKFFLNGKSVFQRLVLDQGFYPDGIYTAPSDAELEADIKRSMVMGFNGARLHQKVFEERFLYHADRLGYIVWGEFPNWGLDHTYADSVYGILPEWLEEVKRDFNHPCIVGWCPYNETWDQNGRQQFDDALALVYHATKAADPTRPCIDTSGNFHVAGCTDVYDTHDYNQDPVQFESHYHNLPVDGTYTEENRACRGRQNYDNKLPFFISEYGGIRWSDKDGWGYGEGPKTEEEFLARIKGLTDAILDNPAIFAYCYTQLTDVEQEQNGLYTYDRKAKFPPEVIKAILGRKAAVEE